MDNKIFNDCIHGHIELSWLSCKIIDTPQFQRLRDISQLGGVYYVFGCAASKRFEHSIGVSHLARTFISFLAQNQPELHITREEILCVEIAGLCHDLGHGPFSHLFDGKVLPRLGVPSSFMHEHASIAIFDLLIKENSLESAFARQGLGAEHIHLIKEMILGDAEEAPQGFKWVGWGDRTFLYDIVANKRNGIDVDKFDYFARDCHVLGVTKSFDASRLMRFARVHWVNKEDIPPSPGAAASGGTSRGAYEICFHLKECWNIMELFHTRYALHKRAYQHKVAQAVELMFAEALVLANPHILTPGTGGSMRTMAQCVDDMGAYWRLGEHLIKTIEHSVSAELASARAIIERVRRRDLYSCCGEVLLKEGAGAAMGSAAVRAQLLRLKEAIATSPGDQNLEPTPDDDIICVVVTLGYGKGGKNPVSELTTFYAPRSKAGGALVGVDGGGAEGSADKEAWQVGVVPEDAISRLLPRKFEETYVRVFCKFKHQKAAVQRLFQAWCASIQVPTEQLSPKKRPCSEL